MRVLAGEGSYLVPEVINDTECQASGATRASASDDYIKCMGT